MIPAASGLSPVSAQVLGGLPGVNWTDLFARLMGLGQQDTTLGNLMMPTGSIPQLGPINPKPRIPVSPARAPISPAVIAPAIPLPLSFMGTNAPQAGGLASPPGVGGDVGYGSMGMGVTGQGAFGDLGAYGMGYGDSW